MAAGRVLIFGGRGLVGTAICRELVRRGTAAGTVATLGRSDGQGAGGPPVEGVLHHSGVDALKPETFKQHLDGAHAVVVTIGEPPWILDRERAIRSNGATNVSILRAAAEHKVPRVVLVNATMPSWSLISGYREGKEMAEAEARQYPESCGRSDCGVLVVKPSAVSGSRYEGSMKIPLWLILEPMRAVFRLMAGVCGTVERLLPSLFGGVLRPPVRVEEIAAAAVDAIKDPSFSGVRTLGTDALVGYSSKM
eukprot:gnl/TRDRNA2_/TRDRNA2_190802_c0_seq1.p1 gnl/TRDRNA2_/TRDRNA2_190802_c0~~gnl/TRDRNA2_/TRDRNA2_190802_c0_seq1.p1  ORF type:complete len:251 (+),score=43.66 gnl/TRDRNA2_/TRDRNA2_190802_c0_seq1:61-813(+)